MLNKVKEKSKTMYTRIQGAGVCSRCCPFPRQCKCTAIGVSNKGDANVIMLSRDGAD